MVASRGSLEAKILFSNIIEAPSDPLASDACTGIETDHDMANNEATISSENRLPMNIGLKLLGIEPCYSAVGAARVRRGLIEQCIHCRAACHDNIDIEVLIFALALDSEHHRVPPDQHCG